MPEAKPGDPLASHPAETVAPKWRVMGFTADWPPARLRAEHRDVAGVILDTFQPGGNRGKGGKIEPAIMRIMGIGIKRDISHCKRFTGQERRERKLPLHDAERAVAALKRSGKPLRRGLGGPFRILHQRPPDGDKRLVAILLEKEPLIDQRALVGIGRQETAAFGKIEQYGVGLGEKAPSASCSTGTLPLGFLARKSGLRVDPSRELTSICS